MLKRMKKISRKLSLSSRLKIKNLLTWMTSHCRKRRKLHPPKHLLPILQRKKQKAVLHLALPLAKDPQEAMHPVKDPLAGDLKDGAVVHQPQDPEPDIWICTSIRQSVTKLLLSSAYFSQLLAVQPNLSTLSSSAI